MQRFMLCCCFSFFWLVTTSQRVVDVDKEPSKVQSALNYMYTVAGTPFVTAKFSKVVEGSPFFNEQIMHGSIILSEGREYRNVLVRLNLLESQVNYISEKEIEMVATSPIREVVLWDTITHIDHRFIFCDYIESTDKVEKDFYELLQSGKAELYKQYKKKLLENRPYGSATTEQTIQTELRYFVLLNGKWTRARKIKELTALLDNKKTEIQKFISDKKIAGDSQSNFEAMTAYYNTLFNQ